MEFYPLVTGKRLPEVYHLGYNGERFQVFLPPLYWVEYVGLEGEGTHFASRNPGYVTPLISGGAFGQHGCAFASKTLDGFVCIEVPASIKDPDDEEHAVTMRVLGHTLASILFILRYLLNRVADEKGEAEMGTSLQLFVLETFVAFEPGQFHGAGLDLSLSPVARKYLEGKGNNICFHEAVKSMCEHYTGGSDERTKLFSSSMDVHLRTNGVIHMHTVGDCACLGTIPRDFGDEGYSLSSHNVDTVFQQFNLLVGIASIWQMVRDGLHAQSL